MTTLTQVQASLSSELAAMLPPGVYFDEIWVEAGGAEALLPLFAEEEPTVARAVEKRQREFRAGRHVARRAIQHAGGPLVAIPRGPLGEPGFPPGFNGSITHTGRARTYAAAVVTREPWFLGLDAECQEELSPDLTRRIATPDELALAQRTSREPGLLVFAAKEAVYKCVFPMCRRVLGFEEVRLERALGDRLEFHVPALDSGPEIEVRWLRAAGMTVCLARLSAGF